MCKRGKEILSNKTIWIIDHYSTEPIYGGISRQYDFAMELGRRGYKVVVIAAGFCHFTHKYIVESDQFVKISEISPNVHYIYLRVSEYKSNSGAERARNMVDFMIEILRYEAMIARRFGKPDVVTGCSVHPLTWIAAYRVAKKYHVNFIAEVRDFWPRIWVASGDKKSIDPMVLFFDLIQHWAYRNADKIIYSMFHGDKYICDEIGISRSKVYLIGQPMDCERFDENSNRIDLLPESIREFAGIGIDRKPSKEQTFLCSFAGYYMAYEGVYVMLEAMRILRDQEIPVKMIFVGSGQEKKRMEKYVEKNKLANVLIHDRISKEAVPALLSHSDICIAHLEIEGHKEVYKYGVSKNKVNEYLYSGACTLYGFMHKDDEVAMCGGGMMFEPYDAEDLAAKIAYVYRQSPSERKEYGKRGREYIRSTHSVKVLTDQMLEVLFG